MNLLILQKMGFKPTAHNEIYLDHLETITDFLIEQCPVNDKKAISMLRGSTGISIRYVKEIIDSLLAWGIIRKRNNAYEWMLEGCQEKKITLNIKNEDVPDTFPGDIGIKEEELKPCTHRTDKMLCMAIPGHIVKVEANKCNMCGSRQEGQYV